MSIKNEKLCKLIVRTFALMLSCIYLFGSFLGLGKEILVYATEHTAYIEDQAELLSSSDLESLQNKLTEYANEAGFDLVVLTTDDLNNYVEDDDDAIASYVKTYLEDYVDEHCDNGIFSEDVAILYFDSNYRWLNLQGYGNSELLLNNKRIEVILDNLSTYFRDNDYYHAFLNFGKEAKKYATMEPGSDNGIVSDGGTHSPDYDYSNQTTPGGDYEAESPASDILYHTGFQLIIAAFIGIISVAIMAARSGGSVTTNNHTYLDEGNSGIVAHRDDYIRTSVTKVKRPEPSTTQGSSNKSFHSGGGVSSGGRSHSGGGRRV